MTKIDKVVEIGDQVAEAQAKHLKAMAAAASGAIRDGNKSDWASRLYFRGFQAGERAKA